MLRFRKESKTLSSINQAQNTFNDCHRFLRFSPSLLPFVKKLKAIPCNHTAWPVHCQSAGFDACEGSCNDKKKDMQFSLKRNERKTHKTFLFQFLLFPFELHRGWLLSALDIRLAYLQIFHFGDCVVQCPQPGHEKRHHNQAQRDCRKAQQTLNATRSKGHRYYGLLASLLGARKNAFLLLDEP